MPRKPKTIAAPPRATSTLAKTDSRLFDNLTSRIHTIRGVQVMLDRDLAELYGVTPRRLREQVRRNIERFPGDFMFELNENEVKTMVSQNAIPSRQHLGGALPIVFSEQGVASLSGVLTGHRAVHVYISIMRAFVEMRRTFYANIGINQRLSGLELRQTRHENKTARKFEQVFNALDNPDTPPKQGIFFDGQVYDAHAFISTVIRQAKRSIILIDNYVDDTVLTLLSKRREGVHVDLYTHSANTALTLDVVKHNAQYPTLTLHEFKDSHDRFLILDDKTVYHLGASLKDAGKKWFGFSRFDTAAFQLHEKLRRIAPRTIW